MSQAYDLSLPHSTQQSNGCRAINTKVDTRGYYVLRFVTLEGDIIIIIKGTWEWAASQHHIISGWQKGFPLDHLIGSFGQNRKILADLVTPLTLQAHLPPKDSKGFTFIRVKSFPGGEGGEWGVVSSTAKKKKKKNYPFKLQQKHSFQAPNGNPTGLDD